MMQTSMDTSMQRYPSMGSQLYPSAPLKKPYQPPFAVFNILSIVVLFIGLVLFMAAFSENTWFVVPEGYAVTPMSFGLWFVCIRERCVVEMTNDYMVKQYLAEYPIVIPAYEQFLMPVKVLMCIGVLTVLASLVLNLLFLAGFATFFLEVALQLLTGLLGAISVGIFGGYFRDFMHSAPFGTAYWLAVVATMIFIVNGLVMLLISLLIFRQRGNSFFRRK